MLSRIRKAKEENEGGFTLIELLVVVVIIGILAAIAIPTFLDQREKAWERAALSDLRNASVNFEEYFSDNGVYPAEDDLEDIGLKLSDGVTIVAATGGTGYCIQVAHENLVGETFALDSENGIAQKDATCS